MSEDKGDSSPIFFSNGAAIYMLAAPRTVVQFLSTALQSSGVSWKKQKGA